MRRTRRRHQPAPSNSVHVCSMGERRWVTRPTGRLGSRHASLPASRLTLRCCSRSSTELSSQSASCNQGLSVLDLGRAHPSRHSDSFDRCDCSFECCVVEVKPRHILAVSVNLNSPSSLRASIRRHLRSQRINHERLATDIGGHTTPSEEEIRTTMDLGK